MNGFVDDGYYGRVRLRNCAESKVTDTIQRIDEAEQRLQAAKYELRSAQRELASSATNLQAWALLGLVRSV